MVLGTYHFAKPGADTHNMIADDVLQPRRQKELESLALAAKAPAFVSEYFSRFKEAQLEKDRNEKVQIGFRLAMTLPAKSSWSSKIAGTSEARSTGLR